MKKLLIFLLLATAGLAGLTSSARAANESIGLSMDARSASGPLYRELPRPLVASLRVTVGNPPAETKVTPLKVANVTFPGDMGFYPNNRKTPACPESKLGDQSNLAAGVAEIVSACPRSVIGTGTAIIQLGQNKSPASTLTDPELVVFNAGRDSSGRPKVMIYGYSRTVNYGLLMRGRLAANGELRIEIGVLPFDSSITEFTLGIPGTPLEVEDTISGHGTKTVKGLDPDYLRARCSKGTWLATGSFVLGTRSFPGGTPLSEDSVVDSNPFSLPCHGLAGKPKLKMPRVEGARRLRTGSHSTFRVSVSNTGTATARSVRLEATGPASGHLKVGSLAPGEKRTVKIAVTASKQKQTGQLRFRLSGKKTGSAGASRRLVVG